MITKVLLLILFTLGAWLIHSGVTMQLATALGDTKSLAFRVAHIGEVGIITYLASHLYVS